MSRFRRRRAQDDLAALESTQGSVAEQTAGHGSEELPDPASGSAFVRDQGPWDVSEKPDAEGLDFGSLVLPPPPDETALELSLEFDQEGSSLVGLSLGTGDSGLQVLAFAAPRGGGLWREVRAELAESLTAQGGVVTQPEGPFGVELTATLPVALPDGTPALSMLRFLGVDGPRWFLRGVISGAATQKPETAALLEQVFRGVVVRRGGAAMPPREALPLVLPQQLAATVEQASPAGEGVGAGAAEAGAADPAASPSYEDLNPFERGPEITEIR